MDKYEQLRAECSTTIGILGNENTRDFILLDAEGPWPDEVTVSAFRARGLEFLGLMGLSGLEPLVALEFELRPESKALIIAKFLALFDRALTGCVEQMQLEKMLEMPDPRA